MSKAGKSTAPVGSEHPNPETIPHAITTTGTAKTPGALSPKMESHLLHEATREIITNEE